MKNLQLNQLNIQKLDVQTMKNVKGGITLQQFAETIHWLLDNGHYAQSKLLMLKYHAGEIQFED